MRLIDADKLKIKITGITKPHEFVEEIDKRPTVKAIPVEQLLSILPKYDDYIHMKTYLYNETMEDIYSKGHEDGWNACLKAIKEELDYWEEENEVG